MTIQEIDLSSLKLYDKNPRKITKEAIDKLCKSLQDDPDFLTKRPILVNKINDDLIVYAGNQRVRAAKKLKWKKIPCIIEENINDDLMRKRIIKDNKTFGEFDYDMLANEWEVDILQDAGFTEQELQFDNITQIESNMLDEDENGILEPTKDPKTKLGDLYILGDHRLKCGDSTNPDDVLPLLNDEEPILMVTDPPYGVNYDASWREKSLNDGVKRATGKVQNDDKVNWALAWHLFPGSVAYVWHADRYCSEVQNSLNDAEFEIINQIIWVKQHFALSRGDYHWQHEPCWYACRKDHPHNWQGSRKEATVWQISNLNAFGTNKEDERTAHSTQKPLECMSRPIRNNTTEGEGVYDPFCGSGTTLIAAEQLKRKSYCMELDPAYCDIIVDRWIRYRKKNNLDYEVIRNGEKIEWGYNGAS